VVAQQKQHSDVVQKKINAIKNVLADSLQDAIEDAKQSKGNYLKLIATPELYTDVVQVVLLKQDYVEIEKFLNVSQAITQLNSEKPLED